ncbi:DUF4333 domain-containing protein [Streptomyces tubercidicus]|uniref:DUF4333 domain-containing protein n=1 Tax=Streptomyces tubercidicus TaxID=47759 RepID=A0A640V224_9ACTN|nr:DUF4333 domain-containing protein [Streptomyces tubercidicus]WAU15170.1 DUF4333 domain-containing protein [Streptomyces tubercidicus]WSK38208.1 DUF4333 domain-containing protein [Streptomyces tubercidicus]GFE40991.1 hypothetical protein Stube_56640 [Streptomyces tubercidicus]
MSGHPPRRALLLGLLTALAAAGVLALTAARLRDRDATSEVDGGTHTVLRTEIARTLSGQLTLPFRNGPDAVHCSGDLRPVRYDAVRCTAHFPIGLNRHLTVEVTRVRHNLVTYRRHSLPR